MLYLQTSSDNSSINVCLGVMSSTKYRLLTQSGDVESINNQLAMIKEMRN